MNSKAVEHVKLFSSLAVEIVKKFLFSSFFRHVYLITFSNVTTAFLGFIQTIIVARWLGPEQYGLVALTMNYPQLIYSILDARTIEGTTKYLSEFLASGNIRKALAICKISYTIDLGISILAFLIVAITASWSARSLFKQPSIAPLMVLYALALFPRGIYNTSHAVLVALHQFTILAWTNLLCRSVQFFSVLFLAYFWGITGLLSGIVLGTLLQALITTYWAYLWIRKEWGKAGHIQPLLILRGRMKEIFCFYLFTNATLLVALPMQQLDITLLGYFRTPSEVGLYKIAKTLASSIIYFIDALQQVSYPRLASKIQDKLQFIRQLRHLAFLGIVVGSIVFVSVVFAICVLSLMGQHFSEAISPLVWLWTAFTLRAVFFWLRPFFLSTGKVIFWFGLQSGATLLGSIPMFIGAMFWGANGVAASILAYYGLIFLFGLPVTYIYCRRDHSVAHS